MSLLARDSKVKSQKFKPKIKRLRIFAGPNGSGKSTLFHEVRSYLGDKTGIWVNADEIQRELNSNHHVELANYRLSFSQTDFEQYFLNSSREFTINDFIVTDKHLSLLSDKQIDAYTASMIAEFFREKLLINGESIAFETVMSHPSKTEWMLKAKKMGYRVYLYYVSTDSINIQKDRVRLRVLMNGHDVDEKKIEDRYYRSLDLVRDALESCVRAWFFDNSEINRPMQLVAEMDGDSEIEIHTNKLPAWFFRAVINKL